MCPSFGLFTRDRKLPLSHAPNALSDTTSIFDLDMGNLIEIAFHNI